MRYLLPVVLVFGLLVLVGTIAYSEGYEDGGMFAADYCMTRCKEYIAKGGK